MTLPPCDWFQKEETERTGRGDADGEGGEENALGGQFLQAVRRGLRDAGWGRGG